MLNSIEDVSVVDVYDLASDIGTECEKLIDLYGNLSVKTLIPKCITALEMLEALATKNERESSLIQELNDRIAKLEEEKVERAVTKKKFEKVSECGMREEKHRLHTFTSQPYGTLFVIDVCSIALSSASCEICCGITNVMRSINKVFGGRGGGCLTFKPLTFCLCITWRH